MPWVLFYLVGCSIRNRLRVRLRRLKEPRYLFGLIVGVAYLYTIVFRHAMGGRPGAAPGAMVLLERSRATLEFVGVIALFVVAAAAWVMPGSVRPRPIEFTRAEVQFLFQAPVSRRQLLHYHLLRRQIGVLFSSVVWTLFLRPGSLASAWPLMAGMWGLLAIVRLYFMGAALRQQSLMQHGTTGVARQWVPVAVVAGAVLILVAIVGRDWPVLSAMTSGEAVFQELRRLAETGAAQWILWPFRAVVRLPMSATPQAFLRALPAALALLLLNYIWVLRSDASFEEASAAYAETRALARGTAGAARPRASATAAPFTLALVGPAETAILWKNLIVLGRFASLRVLVRFAPVLLMLAAIFSHSRGRGGVTELIAVVSLAIAALTVLVGPQIMRNDLRQDLASLAVLKSWPVRGAAVIRGELLAPAVVLTIVVWLLIVMAAFFIGRPGSMDELIVASPVRYATAAMIVAPPLILAQLVLQNGIAIVFPAWVAVGASRSRGIDAIGQRLLMMAGIMLTLVVALLPATIAAGVIGFPIYVMTQTIPVVTPALVVAVVVIVECWGATTLLGRVFDRTDISSVEPAE